ncbi:MAG TPA: aldehyde dehydrogenase family protein, partial [Aggregatilineales bacterium]|nr:aldehyde dehydrogenase family protein [Aggregatilineales bacterium]
MVNVQAVFETMEYGPAPESAAPALEWLKAHGPVMSMYINGAWVAGKKHFETINPATGQALTQISHGSAEDVEAAIQAARTAQATWGKLPGTVRARYMYAIARHVQKHSRLLAVLESMDNGKPIRESR